MKHFFENLIFLACVCLAFNSLELQGQIFQPNSQPTFGEELYPSPSLERADINFPSSNNLLKNGSFNNAGHRGNKTEDKTAAHVSNGAKGRYSAAEHWTTWTGTYGYMATRLLPSTLVRGNTMIEVNTGGAGNGLVQVFGKLHTGPPLVEACVWIKVVEGKVGVGIGNGGNTHVSAVIEATGRWERIMITNAVAPANEIIIYTATQGASFFVESASVRVRGETVDYSCCSPE